MPVTGRPAGRPVGASGGIGEREPQAAATMAAGNGLRRPPARRQLEHLLRVAVGTGPSGCGRDLGGAEPLEELPQSVHEEGRDQQEVSNWNKHR